MIARRTVNGATVRYIEILDEVFQPMLPGAAYSGYPPAPAIVTYGYTVDCGVSFDNAAGQTVFAVPHLIGKTVDIVADGAVQTQQTVDGSGNVTLPRASYRTLIGLHFRSEIGLLTPEVGTGTGTAQGNNMRTSEITLRFLNTIRAQVYDGEGNEQDVPFRRFRARGARQGASPSPATCASRRWAGSAAARISPSCKTSRCRCTCWPRCASSRSTTGRRRQCLGFGWQ